MGLGREVADAYISVHGDLSDFRKDLNKAKGDVEKLAKQNAQEYADAFGDRLGKAVESKWNSIIDSMHSGKKIDFDRMIGEFDANGDLEKAQQQINDFILSMRRHGKMSAEEYRKTKDAVNDTITSMRQLNDLENERLKLLDQTTRGTEMAADANKRLFAEADAANEKWARTLDGMRKNNSIAAMEADFKKLAETMNSADMEKFGKGFDNLHQARARIYEITAAMEQQGRMSRAQSEEMQKNIEEYIGSVEMQKRLEEEAAKAKSKAMRDALDETKRLKDAQDRYNNSLAGMARNYHFGKMEQDFRNLAAAMDSNDFSHFARGAIDIEHMRRNIVHAANEMRRFGRMTDTEYGLILDRVQELNHSFANGGGGDFFRNLRNGADGFGNAMGRVNKVTRGFREHLQGFAGLNVFGDMIRKGLDFVHNLDRIALHSARTATALGAMSSIGGSSLAGLIVIAGDLGAVLGGTAALMPAYLIGAGIAGGVLVSAFKDMKTVLADLKPKFADLQNVISQRFWKEAAAPIRDMVNGLMPTLKTQLGNTATAFGTVFDKLATAIGKVPKKDIETMFERMNRGIKIAGGAMGPLVNAFKNLGLAGSKTFERFGKWIVKISEQFDDFIQKASDNGDLDKWIDNAIEGFKDIGRTIDGLFGIFNALDSAAREAGSGGLSEFADKLQGIAETMQSPRFQDTMIMLFSGMNQAVKNIGQSLYDLGPALESVMPSIKLALEDIGAVVATIIDYVGDILMNPKIQQGITDFSSGMVAAIEKLEPAIKPFGDSLGTMMSLLGEIIESVAQIATTFMVELSPVLDRMSEKLGELVTPLSDAASNFIRDMKGPLETIEKQIIEPLVSAIKDNLLPALTGPGGFSEEFGKFASEVISAFSPALKTLFSETLPAAVTVVTELLDPLGKLFGLFTPTLNKLLQEAAAGLTGLGNAIKFLKGEMPLGEFELFKPGALEQGAKDAEKEFKDVWENRDKMTWGDIIAALVSGDGASAGQALGVMWTEKIFPPIRDVWENVIIKGISMIFEGRMFGDEVKKNLEDFWADDARIAEDIDREVNKWFEEQIFKPMRELGETLGQLWDDTIGAFFNGIFGGGAGESSYGGGGGPGAKGVTGKLDPAMLGLPDEEGTRGWFEEFGTWLGEGITSALGRFGEALGLSTLAEDWTLFWSTFPTKVQETWDAVVLWVQTKTAEIKLAIDTWAADTKLNWDNFWNGVKLKVEEIWNAVTTWIQTKVGEIKTNITTFITETKLNWDNFWNGVKDKVTTIWNDVKTWIDTKVREIKTNISNFTRDVKTNWDNFWRDIGQKVRTGWDDIVRAFQTGVDRAVEWVRGLPGKAVAALGNLGSKLEGHGREMIEGFKRGLETAFENVKSFVGTIAQWIADNKGPISYDRVLLVPAGKAIMDGLGVGLRSQLPALKDTLDVVTATMTDGIAAAFAHSKMYVAGADAALGLAAGLKDNKGTVLDAFGALLPAEASVSLGGSGFGGVGGSTPSNTTIINVAEGAMPITTPTENPELVASKVIDGFATTISNF